jgi:hypothetical protein
MNDFRLSIDFESHTAYILDDTKEKPTIASVSFRKVTLSEALCSLMIHLTTYLRKMGE